MFSDRLISRLITFTNQVSLLFILFASRMIFFNRELLLEWLIILLGLILVWNLCLDRSLIICSWLMVKLIERWLDKGRTFLDYARTLARLHIFTHICHFQFRCFQSRMGLVKIEFWFEILLGFCIIQWYWRLVFLRVSFLYISFLHRLLGWGIRQRCFRHCVDSCELSLSRMYSNLSFTSKFRNRNVCVLCLIGTNSAQFLFLDPVVQYRWKCLFLWSPLISKYNQNWTLRIMLTSLMIISLLIGPVIRSLFGPNSAVSF